MKNTKRSYRKFLPQQKNIEELEKQNSRFKRIYSEYETMSDELWDLENNKEQNVTDDHLDAMHIQTTYLENEIEEWLLQKKDANNN